MMWKIVTVLQLTGLFLGQAAKARGQDQPCLPAFTFRIGDSSSIPVSYQCTLTAQSTQLNYTLMPSQSWITVSPVTGSIAADQTGDFTISVNPAGLSASPTPYTGTISTTAAGYSIAPVTVTLTVSNPPLSTPQINGAVNAATYAPGGPLAPGLIFTVFGTSLTDGSTSFAPSIPLPTLLAGATLLVNGTAAPLFYTSPTQINAQFPVELASLTSATIQVQVQSAGGTVISPAFTVSVTPFSPGIFTWDQNGSGPGAIVHASSFVKICPQGRTDCAVSGAAPGEAIAIYMTGLGQVTGPWPTGQAVSVASPTVTAPTVMIGGVQAKVLFAGLATSYVGLYQVNVLVPSNAPTGRNLPLVLNIGGTPSNQVLLAVGNAPPPLAPVQFGGPPEGVITALAVDPRNPTTLYAGTGTPHGGGIFKSTNGGVTWTAVNSGLTDLVIQRVVIDPSNSSTLYAGTISKGIFKSTNGGASWTAVNFGLTIVEVDALAIDPANPSTLYAGTAGFQTSLPNNGPQAIFKSSNGGASWNAVGPGYEVFALAVDPVSPSTVYAGVVNPPFGALKSTDGGISWMAINSGLGAPGCGGTCTAFVRTLAVDPTHPLTVYAGTNFGVFKSTNGGANWTAINSSQGVLSEGVLALVIDPARPSFIYIGTSQGILESENGGSSWTASGFGLTEGEIIALAVDPVNSLTLYAGTNGYGVFKSVNAGANWVAANSGLTNANVDSVAVSQGNPLLVYASADGIFRSDNGGGSWTSANAGLPGRGGAPYGLHAQSLVIDQTTTSTLYCGIATFGVFKTTDGGANWTAANSGLAGISNSNSGIGLAIDPVNPSVLYARTNGLFKTVNGGSSWNLVSSALPNTATVGPVIDPSNPSTLYIGTFGGGVFKSTNGGVSWTQGNSGLTLGGYIDSLAIDPMNPSTLYSGTNGFGIFKSTNGGSTWVASGVGSLLAYVYALAVNPTDSAIVYAGAGGVFKSTDRGATWTPSGLQNLVVQAINIDPTNSAILYAGTDGGGVFKSTDAGQTWQPTGSN